jgi:hypothetical protein
VKEADDTAAGTTSETGGDPPWSGSGVSAAATSDTTDGESGEEACQDATVPLQNDGDCKRIACDGIGETIEQVDDTDVPDDGNACTVGTCADGDPQQTPVAEGEGCEQDGGHYCSADAACVECLEDTHCDGEVCTAARVCVPAQCNDGAQNGTETDTDCGGPDCPDCAPGLACVEDGDCTGESCIASVCVPTCIDGVQNQDETDEDCGGSACDACGFEQGCRGDDDCGSEICEAQTCQPNLLISEIRSRGAGSASDEFVELYNPTSSAVMLSSDWQLDTRSSGAASYGLRWTGEGLTIPAHGYFLLTGSNYAQSPAGDAFLSSGITDAGSLRLRYGDANVDVVCYAFNDTTLGTLAAPGYDCEGIPADNLPHNNGNSMASNSDVSIERGPGGAQGNGVDTDANAADFATRAPALPQNRLSPPLP